MMFLKRRCRGLLIALLAIVSLAASPAWAAQRVALVIGASDYQNVPSLANPTNDARDVAEALRRLDFEVDLKPNLDANALRLALQAFRQRTQGAEVAVIFYAGHGIAVDGVTRLVPVDARLATEADVDFETVPLDLVTNAMDGASTLRLAILDACRDNPFLARMAPSGGRKRNISRGLAAVEPQRGDTLVWYAARDGATASDGNGRNSPFTSALLSHIEKPGLEIDRLFRVVRDSVVTKTGIQEPFVYGSRGAKDFYFQSASLQPQAVPQPSVSQPLAPQFQTFDAAKLAYDDAKKRGTKAALEDVAAIFPETYWGRVAQRDAEAMVETAMAPPQQPQPQTPIVPEPQRVAPPAAQQSVSQPLVQQPVAPQAGINYAPTSQPSAPVKSTLVVDPSGAGDHVSIQDAINAAPSGGTVLVRPGRYREGIDISKPLTIKGDGDRGTIIVEASGTHVIRWNASTGSISGLTLRQSGGAQWVGIDIRAGNLLLENNDIMSNSPAVVAIYNSAAPTIRGNTIRDSQAIGIVVFQNGQGRIEDNDIFGNTKSGIEIHTGGNPVVSGNRIHDGKASGIYVYNNGLGRIENNEIFGNAQDGIVIANGGDPVVTGNRIRDGKVSGINVFNGGKGKIENNEIFGNARAGIFTAAKGNPVVTGNRIQRNGYVGVWVHDGGGGVYTDNDLTGNTRGSFDVGSNGGQIVRRNNQTQ